MSAFSTKSKTMNIYTFYVVDKNGKIQTIHSTLKGSKYIKNKIHIPSLRQLHNREITGRMFPNERVP